MENSESVRGTIRFVTERPRTLSLPFTARDAADGGRPGTRAIPSRIASTLSWAHPEWAQRFPWLVQGTTGRSPGPSGGDFRLFGAQGSPEGRENWTSLARSHGFAGVVHSRQVHGKKILIHASPPEGVRLGPEADGHVSAVPGTLMGVTVADCVPVFLVDPHRRVVGLLHAGWRGTAAGILEEGISVLAGQSGAGAGSLLVHLGPAICGSCYEVGPEVHTALGLQEPRTPAPLDLRGLLAERAFNLGVMGANITRSTFCTLCGGSPFFSHRGGAPQRQIGFLGIGSSLNQSPSGRP
jgi:YfiH family protein